MTREELWVELDEMLLELLTEYERLAESRTWDLITPTYWLRQADHVRGLRCGLKAALLGEEE